MMTDTSWSQGPSFSLLVQPEHLANRFKDAILPPVFATPVMIMVMENAALNAIRAYLDPGESAGRARRSTCAISRRPRLGAWLPGRLMVTKVDGRQIEVHRPSGPRVQRRLVPGSHSRVVIDVAKFARRLE